MATNVEVSRLLDDLETMYSFDKEKRARIHAVILANLLRMGEARSVVLEMGREIMEIIIPSEPNERRCFPPVALTRRLWKLFQPWE